MQETPHMPPSFKNKLVLSLTALSSCNLCKCNLISMDVCEGALQQQTQTKNSLLFTEDLSIYPHWSALQWPHSPAPSTSKDLWPHNITMHTDTVVNLCTCVRVRACLCVVREAEGGQAAGDGWLVCELPADSRQTSQRNPPGSMELPFAVCLPCSQNHVYICGSARTHTHHYKGMHTHACAHTQKLFYYHSLWLAIFGAFYNHSHPHLYNSMTEKTWLTKKKLRSGWIIHTTLGRTAKCSLRRNSVCRSWWIMKTLFSRCISLHYFQNATKTWVCACVCVCDYADHECSSCRVQHSRLDTVNVGQSPGCWIMDQRRTRAQPNAAWSDVTVIFTDWCRPRRPDSPALHTDATCMYALTHQQTSANSHKIIISHVCCAALTQRKV